MIHSAVARDPASVAALVMYETEASSTGSGVVASSLHGAGRSAAALAYSTRCKSGDPFPPCEVCFVLTVWGLYMLQKVLKIVWR